MPLARYGLVFYVLLFVLSALELFVSNIRTRRVIQLISALWLIASAYFVFLQTVVSNAFCSYCIASALITFAIFALAYCIESLSQTRNIVVLPTPSRVRLTLPPLS